MLKCKFCERECKNKNSLTQHEIRCKQNPDRKDYDRLGKYITNNRKGKTKDNCEEIARQAATIKQLYANGYLKSHQWQYKDKDFYHYYEEHNNEEIKKWFNYLSLIELPDKDYDTIVHEDYFVISKKQIKINNTIKPLFEHNYIANILLNGNLKSNNNVHHIDENKQNNDKYNLLIFQDRSDHKRFHTSKYAYLIYNEETHLFVCENRKIIE